MSDKKQQLLEASIDLFAREGFWNTSTASIAKHAGVATGTLFNYFVQGRADRRCLHAPET
ncbi:MAG: helix-turn-helix transcriptional regulator [Caldilinea sp.]|nr:helix-turn-helix transcriptional regulator [Caldilinea sp.]